MTRDIDGYVADSLYPSLFHDEFAPPAIDAMLLRDGLSPPRGAGGGRPAFRLVDLGCGDGFGLILLAAAYPEAEFLGIDAMSEHIARGKAAITELGLTNIGLHCATFGEALSSDPFAADYVTAQGVLSWISPVGQADLLALAARNLREGGVAAIGYNALPGWIPMIAFQKLVRTLSLRIAGTPVERFEAAVEKARALGEAGIVTIDDNVFDWFSRLETRLPREYFAHEYLNGHWRPLWSNEAIARAASHELSFVRGARRGRIREDFILRKAQRDALEAIDDRAERELVADLMLHCGFRIDLYAKGTLGKLPAKEARQAQFARYWALCKAPDAIEFSAITPAGTIRFDNRAAHAIVDRLEEGPAQLDMICDIGEADLLNALDALLLAGDVVPVDPPADETDCGVANRWNASGDDALQIKGAVTPFGVVAVPDNAGRDLNASSGLSARLGLY